MPDTMLSLVSASATRVLGEYDHSFAIASIDEFVIIYGPNGVGKTKFLEIIDALTRLNGSALTVLPFETAALEYSDGSKLSVQRRFEVDEFGDEDADPSAQISFKLERPLVPVVTWNFEDDGFDEWVRRSLPYERISEFLYQDPADGELVHVEELRSRYSHRLRGKVATKNGRPKELLEFVELVPSFLIETQRLRIEETRPQVGTSRYDSARRPKRTRSRITEQADKIKSLVSAAQTEHSRITQQLDRTFPNRVLAAQNARLDLDSDAIRERYNEQNDFRSRLGRVASVDLDDELSLPQGELEGWALRLLKLYLDDADQKLAPFVNLLKKIDLLEQIVNDRLLNKRLQVTDGDGLLVQHSSTGRAIALDALSSGEQHEIILMIDLLFNVPPGAVVLIDEPEISLHVVWQITFIPDVRQIAKLAGFRFVVATHSPQIINTEWDRAVRLGPPQVAFA